MGVPSYIYLEEDGREVGDQTWPEGIIMRSDGAHLIKSKSNLSSKFKKRPFLIKNNKKNENFLRGQRFFSYT